LKGETGFGAAVIGERGDGSCDPSTSHCHQQVGGAFAAARGLRREPDFADLVGCALVVEGDDDIDDGGKEFDERMIVPLAALRRAFDECEQTLKRRLNAS
jgi:hypothetical protein